MGTHCERCSEANPGDARFCKSCGAPLTSPSAVNAEDPLIDRVVLERYRIRQLIGEGGMGRVYAAEQRVGTTVRRVAVKTLRAQLSADPQLMKRFYREAETIVRLTHPNIIAFFDFGALPDGTLVIVMEHIDGESLAAHLARGPLSTARVDAILVQVCGALTEAHGLGIVHRDLKPDNILLTARGGQSDFVKVLDFGIAKISAQEHDVATTKLTQQGMIVGTPPYMSPEQFRGDVVDARSDVYSLGVIAYEMHTGRLPFEARTPWEWASKHLTAEPDQLRVDLQTGVSKQRAQAIRRALAKMPEGRPDTVAMFLEELRSGESGAGRAAPPTPPSLTTTIDDTRSSSEAITVPGLSKGRGAAWWTAVAGATLVAVAIATFVARSPALDPPSHRPPPAPLVAIDSVHKPAVITERPAVEMDPTLADGPAPAATQPSQPQPQSRAKGGKLAPAGSSSRQNVDAVRTPAAAVALRRGEMVHETNESTAGQASVRSPTVRPATAGAAPAAATAPAAGTVVAPTAAAGASASPAVSANGATPSAKPTTRETPPDLLERVAKAQAEAARRPEVAVGMYRGAVSRYGADHPSLLTLAATLRRECDRRIKELLGNDRCAQAQALFRALTSAGLAAGAATSFSARCPAP